MRTLPILPPSAKLAVMAKRGSIFHQQSQLKRRLCLERIFVVVLISWLAFVGFVLRRPLYFMIPSLRDSKPKIHMDGAESVTVVLDGPSQLTGSECSDYPKCSLVTNLPTGLGENCGFNVMNDTAYLPDIRLISCLRHQTRSSSTRWSIDVSRYQQQVEFLQLPARCDAPQSSLGDGKWHTVKFTSHGHGINAFHMAVNAGNHWDRGIPVLASPSAYRFGSHKEVCDGSTKVMRGWSCHMSPLSAKCSLLDGTSLNSTINLNRLEKPHPAHVWCTPNGRYEPDYGRCRCDEGFLPSEQGTHCLSFSSDPMFKNKRKWQPRYDAYHRDDDYAFTGTEHWVSRLSPGEVFSHENYGDPAHWHHSQFARQYPNRRVYRFKVKYGFFWWMLQNIWILHKDAPKRSDMEKRVLEVLGPKDSFECVAVHVRRGDSCDDATARHRTCPKLRVYLDHVRELKAKYFDADETLSKKRFKVFLASDDPSTIEEANAILTEYNIDVVWQAIDRKRYVNGKAVDDNPDLFNDSAMDELYFDLWAISHCQLGFVASLASSVAWNAYALAVGRAGYYIPLVSVDLPWGHPRLGEHHAKHNLFDGTVDQNDFVARASMF